MYPLPVAGGCDTLRQSLRSLALAALCRTLGHIQHVKIVFDHACSLHHCANLRGAKKARRKGRAHFGSRSSEGAISS
jgi:hypothetical protein